MFVHLFNISRQDVPREGIVRGRIPRQIADIPWSSVPGGGWRVAQCHSDAESSGRGREQALPAAEIQLSKERKR